MKRLILMLSLTLCPVTQAQNPTFTPQYVQHWDDSTSLPAR